MISCLNFSCKNSYWLSQREHQKNKILSLKFNNTVTDLSGNKHELIAKNISYTNDLYGNTNNAAYFDGWTSAIITNDDKYDLKTSFTFSVWIKPETNRAYILEKPMDYNGGGPYSFDFFPGKLRIILYFSPSDYFVLEGKTTIINYKWQHVAATWDGNQVRLYYNGKLDNDTILTNKTIMKSSKPLGIGLYQWNPSAFSFQGAMDKLEIYNIALSESEIEAKFKNYK